MVLELRVSIVPSFVVEGQSWKNPIVEVSKIDFFLKINMKTSSHRERMECLSKQGVGAHKL